MRAQYLYLSEGNRQTASQAKTATTPKDWDGPRQFLKILVYLKETVPDAGSQKWRVCQGFLTQPTWHWSFYDAQNCLQIRMSVCGCMPVTTNKVHPSSWICVCVCASGGFGPSVTDPASWPQSSLNTCYHSGNSEPKRTRNLTIKWSNSVKSRIAKSVALLSQQTLS